MKKLILTIVLSLLYLPANGAKVSHVYVDLLKGCAQSVDEKNDTIRHYMARVTYRFFAEGNDSNLADIVITKVNSTQPLEVYEKMGDIGFIKQKHPGDTLKTAYFRIKMTGSVDGEFYGTIVLITDKSRINLMADSLVKLMTNEQKQTLTYVSTNAPIYKDFGQDDIKLTNGTNIVGWRCADGPHGIRYPLGKSNEYAIYGAGDTVTLFPTEASLGCSWDRDLTYRIGAAIGRESRAMGVYCNLGPMCDVVINPRWGRAFETMGEDPYHVGMMAESQVRGLQSEKVIATPKHFGPYVMETERADVTVFTEERTFRELFCVPFETVIKGGARAIMTCYHRVRVQGFTTDNVAELNSGADFAGCNRYNIHTILRRDWGFDGIIMTDWNGTQNADSKYSYETDYDMSMPGGKGGFTEAANNIKSKIWSEEPLNKRARRIMAQKLWAWDGKLPTSAEQLKTHPRSVILSKEHLDLSLEAARKAMTLVKNNPVDGIPVLPLDKSATMKIAVVGSYANLPRPGGGGSSAVTPDRIITPLQGIQELCAGKANITVSSEYTGADVAIVVVGTNGETEDKDRETMALPASPIDQNALVEKVMAQVKKTIVVYTGGSASYAGKWSNAPAILVAFYPGRFQGQAIAEALFGDINPAGHLNVTFPATVNDLPKYDPTGSIFITASVDTAHGYFLFEKKNIKPLFWFGHGLSYTTFTYNNLRIIGGTTLTQGDRIDVEVTVTNSGTRAGDDVVQLYVKPKGATALPRRVKDLRGFNRISLAPQETKTVRFLLGSRDFSVYTPNFATKTGEWTVIPGAYDIIVGSTSDPEVLTGTNDQSVVATVTVN